MTDKTASNTPSGKETSSEKISTLVESVKTAHNIINSIQKDPTENNVRKELGKLVTNRNLEQRELCPHGCSFLCRMCDG
jgi:hypothetical protein